MSWRKPQRYRRRGPASAGLGMLALLVGSTRPGDAEVVLDGKFGTAGPVAGPAYDIGAGLGAVRGDNLFHSFTRFDVQSGETATFSGPANIRNILARVTGGAPSVIDGTVRSTIAGAGLFLVNPAGILFGPNAVVDVSGSFAATTANYLKLANGARFVAALDADDSVLTTDPVVAFGFLDGPPGGIEVQGHLRTGTGGALSVVGGNVKVTGTARLEAPAGQILLAGASGAGEVTAVPVAGTPVSGAGASEAPAGGSGQLVIRGGRLVVDNAMVDAGPTGAGIELVLGESVEVRNGGQVTTTAAPGIPGGDITITAPTVLVDGMDGALPTRIAAETASEDPAAKGGNIAIRASSIEVRHGAEISVSTFGVADAGRIDLETGSLRVEGSDLPQFPTQIAANAAPVIGTASGAGGGIGIRAESMEVLNGAAIMASTMGDADAGTIGIETGELALRNGAITTFTAGAGQGGEIRIHGDHLLIDGPFASITAITTGLNGERPAGAGGQIEVTAGRLQLLNDAAISANTFGDARGGNVRVSADSLELETATFQPGSIPGISAASNPPFFGEGGGGAGGDIGIVAGSLRLRGGMPITTTTATAGSGGNVSIRAGSVALESGSSIQSASTAGGNAGSVSIRSDRGVQLSGQSAVSTSAPQSAGGDIEVRAGTEVRLTDSRITAQAGPGGGGNISVAAPELIYLRHGTLTAEAVGDGGNLTVDPVFFILNDGALVSKSSSANGGNITIRADYFLRSSAVIDASAPFGLPGTVSVLAPDVDLSGSLVALPESLLDVESQLRPDCGVRLSGNVSSFIVTGRGGVPLQPGGFLPSLPLPP